MMWWAMAAKAAQNALGTVATYNQTKLNNKALKYQAQQNRINARLEKMNSELSFRKGEKQEQQIQNAAAKLKGKQKVGFGANGVRLDSRSAQQVLNETDYMAQVDELQTHANALADAWGHRLRATDYENSARISLSQQQNPLQAAISYSVGQFLADIGSFGDLFGGGSEDRVNSGQGNAPVPGTPASPAVNHWTTVNYVKDSWDSNFSLGRGGFSIGNRMPAAQTGFNWWR